MDPGTTFPPNAATRTARRGWLAGFALALTAAATPAAAGLTAAAAIADQPSPELATLEREALALLQTAARAPDPALTVVMIGSGDPLLLLDRAELRIDRSPPLSYLFATGEAVALAAGALSRVAQVPLAPGSHRLQARLLLRRADAPPDVTRTVIEVDRDFQTAGPAPTLLLEVSRGAVLGRAELKLRWPRPAEAATDADHYLPGSAADPLLREAPALRAAGQPLLALQRLYSAQAGGLLPAASDALREQLALARQALGAERGDDDEAAGSAALAAYNAAVAQLRDGRVGEGCAALQALAGLKGDDEFTARLRDRANLVLGYALLRGHAGAAAVPAFGRVRSTGAQTNAALLGLGWALLAPGARSEPIAAPATHQAGEALPRIPTLLQPTLTADIARLREQQPYALQLARADQEAAVRRALVPWTELVGRDPLDPAVQEASVAIPYAMNHLGAHPQAIDYYRRALYLLEAVDAQLQRAATGIAGGALRSRLAGSGEPRPGWPWWIAALPPQHWWLASDPREALAAPDGFYLPTLMEEPGFRAAMEDWHRLGELDAALAALGADATAAPLRARLAEAREALAGRLDALALEQLARLRAQTRRYLGEARFALGRINEAMLAEARR